MKQFLPAALLLLAAGSLLISQRETLTVQPGPQADGSVLLATGWTLRPAGLQIPLSTFPMNVREAPGGKFLVVLEGGYLPPTLTILDRPTLQPVDQRRVDDAWLGLAFAPTGNTFYVSGGSRARVFEFALTPEGKIEERRTFALIPEDQRKLTDFTGDILPSPDGKTLYAAALYRDSIFAVNLETGAVTAEWKSLSRPYKLLMHPGGRSLLVSGWASASLGRHDTTDGRLVETIPVGPAPMDMLVRFSPPASEGAPADAYPARLYVTLSNTNTVAVLGVEPNGRLRPLERINVALSTLSPAGMSPSALALSPDNSRLYVVCADANAVAVANLTGTRSRVEGFIPTGWYPTAALALPDNSLLVLNGRGSRSFPNPQGPNPERAAPLHEGVRSDQYVGVLQRGSASHIPPHDQPQLDDWTRTVLRNSPYNEMKLMDAGVPPGSVVPTRPNDPSPIQHVIYIVKENRTYDQVLGDLGIGNGDPSLTLFPESVTPNHHQLARDFVLLDNFYVNADVSADGHNWSSAAIAPPYVHRMWPNSYAGRRRFYDYEGTERAAQPPAGYIWNNVLAAGLTLRNYGWWVNLKPINQTQDGIHIASVRDPALEPHTSKTFRGYDLAYKDIDRARAFITELKQYEAQGALPNFITLRIGNDHTSGAAANRPTPKAQVADNDLALGMIVEAVSKSPFWAKTAIFVLEDDAQNGPDHVDSHRSPAYVISPYTRGRGIDSTFYNTVSMIRTMGLILGLRPMTIHDAGARPMFAAFHAKPNPAPYSAITPQQSLDELNPPKTALAERSAPLHWAEADMIDDNELNEILWLAIKGTQPPAPTRSYFGR
ncbi:MAG: beta-propeller fold lactonase family protein [Bryobacteraceae bacterium]|nr:beta-propeller fold lactonase family protein [Bryobacteraceae bacterium]